MRFQRILAIPFLYLTIIGKPTYHLDDRMKSTSNFLLDVIETAS